MAMFESTEKQREQLRVLVHFSQKGIFFISPSLKCREHTLVLLVTLKYFPSSLLNACSRFFFIGFSIGNLKNDTFVPSSSRYPFFVHSGTQQ